MYISRHFMKGFLGDITAFLLNKLELFFCSVECQFPMSAFLIKCQDPTPLQKNIF